MNDVLVRQGFRFSCRRLGYANAFLLLLAFRDNLLDSPLADLHFSSNNGCGFAGGLDQLADEEPTPEFFGQIAAEVSRLLSALNVEDENLRQVVLLKLEGYTNDEIAERLATTRRTV